MCDPLLGSQHYKLRSGHPAVSERILYSSSLIKIHRKGAETIISLNSQQDLYISLCLFTAEGQVSYNTARAVSS